MKCSSSNFAWKLLNLVVSVSTSAPVCLHRSALNPATVFGFLRFSEAFFRLKLSGSCYRTYHNKMAVMLPSQITFRTYTDVKPRELESHVTQTVQSQSLSPEVHVRPLRLLVTFPERWCPTTRRHRSDPTSVHRSIILVPVTSSEAGMDARGQSSSPVLLGSIQLPHDNDIHLNQRRTY